MKLVISNDTILKASTAQATQLKDAEKLSVKAGSSFDIAALANVSGHIKFTLKEGVIQGRNTWYVYDKHAVAKDVNATPKGGISPKDFRLNSIGVNTIKEFEGLELEHYICAAGVPTIGLGSTRWFDGSDIPEGATITEEQAVELFERDMKEFIEALQTLINVPLTGKQIAALQSWIYNCGIGALEESTLRKVINQGGNSSEVQAQLMRWTNGGLVGLVRRRERECDLWEGK